MKEKLGFALIMGIVTTGIISFVLISVNFGFMTTFLNTWLRAWGIAYLVVIPVILIFAPRVQNFVDGIFSSTNGTKNSPDKKLTIKNKLSFAFLMGIITTGIISFTVISVNIGFGEHFLNIWLKSWGMSYLAVIPALLLIAPRIQQLVGKLFSPN